MTIVVFRTSQPSSSRSGRRVPGRMRSARLFIIELLELSTYECRSRSCEQGKMLSMRRVFFLAGLVLIGFAALIVGQQRNPALQRLPRKKLFADELRASLSEPFVGVRTSAGIAKGLFPVRATGVSTTPIREAAI